MSAKVLTVAWLKKERPALFELGAKFVDTFLKLEKDIDETPPDQRDARARGYGVEDFEGWRRSLEYWRGTGRMFGEVAFAVLHDQPPTTSEELAEVLRFTTELVNVRTKLLDERSLERR